MKGFGAAGGDRSLSGRCPVARSMMLSVSQAERPALWPGGGPVALSSGESWGNRFGSRARLVPGCEPGPGGWGGGGGGVLQASDSLAGISRRAMGGTARSVGRGSAGWMATGTAVLADRLRGGPGLRFAGGPVGGPGLIAVLWRIRSARWYCSRRCRATSTDRWWTLQHNNKIKHSTPKSRNHDYIGIQL